jgi:nitroreductase
MELETIIHDRYSCRKYFPDVVPHPTIEKILGLAQKTPSWCNTQPWQVLILSGESCRQFGERLYAHALSGATPKPDFEFPLRYEGHYRERRKVCGVQLYQALGIGREDKRAAAEQSLENFRFFGAPHIAFITTEADLGVYGAVDCGLYVAHFMLAAKGLGVDSIAQAALASYPGIIRAEFGLPASRKLVCGIAFGFGDPAHAINGYRTARANLADVVTWRD